MSAPRHPIRDLPDYEARVAAARARARFELGDASWAGVILAAFLDPDEDRATLTAEDRA